MLLRLVNATSVRPLHEHCVNIHSATCCIASRIAQMTNAYLLRSINNVIVDINAGVCKTHLRRKRHNGDETGFQCTKSGGRGAVSAAGLRGRGSHEGSAPSQKRVSLRRRDATLRPISLLRLWISEGLTQAES